MLLKVILLIAGFHRIASLFIDHICVNKNTDCYGSYDSNHQYKVKCERMKCSAKYSYQCGSAYCTTDKLTCIDIHASGLFSENIPSSYSNLLHMKKYKKVIESIKECPALKHDLNPTNVCVKQEYCAQKVSISMRIRIVKITKRVHCQCDGNSHSYQCGNDFCTKSKTSCDALLDQHTEMSRQMAIAIGVKKFLT